MKNILIILALSISSLSFGQGNLQFNQVINQEFNGTYSGYYNAGTITVPAGKVWKIEAASILRTDGSAALGGVMNTSVYNLVVGNHVCVSNGSPGQVSLPFWLSAGTYNVAGYTGNGLPYLVSISAIEFNVVP